MQTLMVVALAAGLLGLGGATALVAQNAPMGPGSGMHSGHYPPDGPDMGLNDSSMTQGCHCCGMARGSHADHGP